MKRGDFHPSWDEQSLFRNFAEMYFSPPTVVGFANKYGLLTDPENGEPLITWKTAIADMRAAVDCWEKARQSDVAFPSNDTGLILLCACPPKPAAASPLQLRKQNI